MALCMCVCMQRGIQIDETSLRGVDMWTQLGENYHKQLDTEKKARQNINMGGRMHNKQARQRKLRKRTGRESDGCANREEG